MIQNSNGNVAEITTREIAEKAAVGMGLINYHFQTKKILIAICVQRNINQVVKHFNPDILNNQISFACMVDSTVQVFEFLFNTRVISRISILGDLSKPSNQSNTIKSQQRICHVLGNCLEQVDKSFFPLYLYRLCRLHL